MLVEALHSVDNAPLAVRYQQRMLMVSEKQVRVDTEKYFVWRIPSLHGFWFDCLVRNLHANFPRVYYENRDRGSGFGDRGLHFHARL